MEVQLISHNLSYCPFNSRDQTAVQRLTGMDLVPSFGIQRVLVDFRFILLSMFLVRPFWLELGIAVESFWC